MRTPFALVSLCFAFILTNARADSLILDNSISGYTLGRGTNTIISSAQVDSWQFDALAGDVISVSVDTIAAALDPYVEVRNSANGLLASDEDNGPGNDSFISAFAIVSSGTYTVRVGARSSATGQYLVRLDVARGVQIESDANYSNDSITRA